MKFTSLIKMYDEFMLTLLCPRRQEFKDRRKARNIKYYQELIGDIDNDCKPIVSRISKVEEEKLELLPEAMSSKGTKFFNLITEAESLKKELNNLMRIRYHYKQLITYWENY